MSAWEHYTKTVPGVGEIQNSDIVKGYEVGQDQRATYRRADARQVDGLQQVWNEGEGLERARAVRSVARDTLRRWRSS